MEKDKTVKKIGAPDDVQVVFFETGDILNALLQFLGTEDFKKMVSSIDNTTKESVFKAGLMLAPSIIFAYCRKFYGTPVPVPNYKELVMEATDGKND